MPHASIPRPAATVVLLRPGPSGPEVLLIQRPSTMAFAPDAYVFPGGAVDPTDADSSIALGYPLSAEEMAVRLGGGITPGDALAFHIAAIRELFEEAGVLLAEPVAGPPARWDEVRSALLADQVSFADVCRRLGVVPAISRLAPFSRWVTPRSLERRFDARFFVAELPPGAEPAFAEQEVVSHRWITPGDALDESAAGTIELWPPTSATLQELEHVSSFDDVVERMAPGPSDPIRVVDEGQWLIRVVLPAAGGISGQPVNAYVVGTRGVVIVDPGDPSEEATDALLDVSARRGSVTGIALTHADPDHLAGAASLATQLAVPIWVGASSAGLIPSDRRIVSDGVHVTAGEIELIAVQTPGHRSGHVSFVLPDGSLIAGDVVGPGPNRSVLGPPDVEGWLDSLDRLEALRPRRVYPGHGDPPRNVGAAIGETRARLPQLAG